MRREILGYEPKPKAGTVGVGNSNQWTAMVCTWSIKSDWVD